MLTDTQRHNLQHDIRFCHDCHVWDPDNQPSVLDNLRKNPDHYKDRLFWSFPNGTFFVTIHGDKIPFWTEYILCAAHQAEYQQLDAQNETAAS